MSKRDTHDDTYLGDGAYAGDGGGDLFIYTERREGIHWIRLKPAAVRALVASADKLWGEGWRGE